MINSPHVPKDNPIDIEAIDQRIQGLLGDRSEYEKQKDRLIQEFETFLLSLPSTTPVSCASPEDVVRFLVFKDKDAKTQVHNFDCVYLGQMGHKPCACPRRLRVGTAKNMVSKLATYFQVMKSDTRRGMTNPARALMVQRYIKKLSEEQGKAHVTVKQAKPLFLPKLLRVFDHIMNLIVTASSAFQAYLYARDITFLKLMYFSGDRAGDLGQVKTQ